MEQFRLVWYRIVRFPPEVLQVLFGVGHQVKQVLAQGFLAGEVLARSIRGKDVTLHYPIFNRPGVAGAVLQTASSLINSLIH